MNQKSLRTADNECCEFRVEKRVSEIMGLLVGYILYTLLLLVIAYESESSGYRVLLGYLLGTVFGVAALFYFDWKVAILVSAFFGAIAIAKMYMGLHR